MLGVSFENIRRLQLQAKFSFTLSSQYISQIMMVFPMIISLVFYFNFDLQTFLIIGLPWALIWTLWIYCGCLVVYWYPSFFFVYCFYLKMRIRTVNQRLGKLCRIIERIQAKLRRPENVREILAEAKEASLVYRFVLIVSCTDVDIAVCFVFG